MVDDHETPKMYRLAIILALAVVLLNVIGPAWAVEADPISPGSWTMVLLPDTQHYVDGTNPVAIFNAQTQWIADHKESHNVKMVLHLGDITNNKTTAEFVAAKAAMDTLRTAGVPYSMAPGNHDYTLSSTTRSTLFNDNAYFGPTSTYGTQSHFATGLGGFYESGKTDNSWCTFNAGGKDWLVFSVEYGPRDSVIGWMNSVATAHPNHNLILNTHAYLYYDSTRYDWDLYGSAQSWNPRASTIYGGTNDGQDLWDELVNSYENWKFTFNGHVLDDGNGWLGSYGAHGNVVHQMLSNYQNRVNGGDGYMRIMEFMADGNTVKVSTYSPYQETYLLANDQCFTLKMNELPPNPLPPAERIRGVSAARLSVNSSSVWTVEGSGPNRFVLLSPANEADVSVSVAGIPAYRDQGVMLTTVCQNSRGGYYGTSEVSQQNFFTLNDADDILQIATSRAHDSGEYNVNVAAAMFPFASGWIGGHVLEAGTLLEHYGVASGNVTRTGTGRYQVTVDGINSQNDGMLFVVGGENGHNNYSTAPLANGSGWEIASRDNAAATFSALEDNRFGFVYIDYNAPGLIGGRISASGSTLDGAGSFSISRAGLGAGEYRITINNGQYTPDEGVLLLTIADYETDGITAPDDNIISYEADGNTFLVNIRDRNDDTSPLEDCGFVFAFLPYDGQLMPAVPGDANYDGQVDQDDADALSNHWGNAGATWANGDFNLDGLVNAADAAILTANWGYGTNEGTGVPEPGSLVLLAAIAMAGLTRGRRR